MKIYQTVLLYIGLLLGQVFLQSNVIGQTDQLTYFHLNQVKLLDSPFRDAMEVNRDYLLEMDVDRLLAPYMLEAGLNWDAKRYGNWEDTGLDGHIGGHYLSALAMLYATTGDDQIKSRMEYMLENLATAQQANGNGYIGGVPGGEKLWKAIKAKDIDAGTFSLNDKWVPLYNIHKIYAGLRDAYLIGGQPEAKGMLVHLTDWFLDLTEDFDTEDFQEILISEHGGLNEVFADVAEITGDKKYLDLAKNMSHHIILDPLSQEVDNLNGMHANTQIPKVIGFQKIAEMDDDEQWNRASYFFWDNVVNSRSVSIGGNSVREHFHSKDNFNPMLSSEQGPETCNTYNMMRLSEKLFQASPDRKFIDYYERALYNHILSSQHPTEGGYVYFTSMRPNHYRVYSQPHNNFWCCVGSGMENHTKYGQVIYAKKDETIFVNLFIASELDWNERGIKIIQSTSFPYEESTLLSVETAKPTSFDLQLRKPSWVKSDIFAIFINGEKQQINVNSAGYISLNRTWNSGDKLEVTLPMEISLEYLPDGSPWASFAYGPIVLASKTGQEDLTGLFADDSRMGHVASGSLIPLAFSTILKEEIKKEKLQRVNEDLNFHLADNLIVGERNHIELIPFFSLHDSRYQIYWPIVSDEEVLQFKKAIQDKDEYMVKLERQTVDFVAAGEQQPESEHSFSSSKSFTGQENGRFWRSTLDWFEYTLQNKDSAAKTLRVVYSNRKTGNPFNIYINGELVNTEKLDPSSEGFTEINYDISSFDHESLKVRFESIEGKETERIEQVRLLKAGR